MKSNIDDFIKETNKEIEKLQKKQISEAKKIVLLAHHSLVDLSPVKDGLFMHNHIMTVNALTNKEIEKKGQDRTEAMSYNSRNVQSLKFNHNDSIYIQNNLQYADALEAGHSSQARGGVYGITEDRMKQFLKRTTLI